MKKAISIMLVMITLVSMVPVQAAPDNSSSSTYNAAIELVATMDTLDMTEEDTQLVESEIDRILSEMSCERMRQCLNEMHGTVMSVSQESLLNEHGTQLEKLGVVELTKEELSEICANAGNDAVQTQGAYTPPESTSSITWYMSGPYSSTLSNGNPIKYFYLRAQPTGMACDLVKSANVPLITSSVLFSDFVYMLGEIYVQKAISLVPIVQWTPYELLFNKSLNSNIQTASSYQVTALMATTAKYVYLGPGGATLDDEGTFNINYLTHSVSVAETHVHSYILDGKAKQATASREYTVACDNYATPLSVAKEYYFYNFAAENPEPLKYCFNSVFTNTVTPAAASQNPYFVG